MLQYQTVSSHLLTVLHKLMSIPMLGQFRLVGGTGLALQLGHRLSVDIDLFTDRRFDKQELKKILSNNFDSYILNWENENGFTVFIDEIKVDFFNWSTSFILPPVVENGLLIMDKPEIGAMKLEAITTRKEKKDFFDIAFLLNEFTIRELVDVFRRKYPYISYKFAIESLTAVDYADKTADPVMLIPLDWQSAKQRILSRVEDFFNDQANEKKKEQEARLRKAEALLKNKKSNK